MTDDANDDDKILSEPWREADVEDVLEDIEDLRTELKSTADMESRSQETEGSEVT